MNHRPRTRVTDVVQRLVAWVDVRSVSVQRLCLCLLTLALGCGSGGSSTSTGRADGGVLPDSSRTDGGRHESGTRDSGMRESGMRESGMRESGMRESGTRDSGASDAATHDAVASRTFTIGGAVAGLAGAGLVLEDNGADDLALGTDGHFTFHTPVASGGAFSVTVKSQPTGPSQACVVSGGAGVVGSGNVTGVVVNCATDTFTVGGQISGLAGGSVVLQDNGGDSLTVNATGEFAFASPVASGAAYAVTVLTQPPSPAQTCTVVAGTGTGVVAAANVTSVQVACTTNAYTVGVSVSGLSGAGLVLEDNGGDDLTVTGSGGFVFATPVPSGAPYTVTVKAQPSGPPQTCVVTTGTGAGTIGAANVTSVAVSCTTNAYTVGGTVSGLAGTGLVLQDNGGDDLAVAASGSFSFATPVTSGSGYAVTIKAQPGAPDNQTCSLSASTGTISAAPVTSVVVTCAITPPAAFAAGQVNVEIDIDTTSGRTPISPLIYGVNANAGDALPAALMKSVTLTRRGGDRGNTYNWETNVSNGGIENGYQSDMTLANGVSNPNAPAGQDLTRITANRAAGRATMVPFVLMDYVAGPLASYIPYDQAGWNVAQYFNKEVIVKPTPFATTPNLTDGVVYTDEQLDYMRRQFAADIMAPGPGQVLVGVDNEADLWEYNFPMLQRGSGDALYAANSTKIGNRLTGTEFTNRFITFATRVKQMAPNAQIVGPAHFGYDGWMCWHQLTSPWSDLGDWYMDDFLAAVSAASKAAGVRLLDTWDMHWYPQATFNGTTVSSLDNAVSPLTAAEIDAIVQGPRSYWDPTYDEGSFITATYHLDGPAHMLTRLQGHLAAGYPGTGLAVSEYFPGGRNHISSGLATVDSLGVFQTLGIELAAMWPLGGYSGLTYAFGGLELVHNADGNGLRYADTRVSVTNPSVAALSVYAGMDTPDRVTVLVVNKTSGPLTVGLRMTNLDRLGTVAIYRIDAADPSPYLAAQGALTLSNAYAYAAPAFSASMLDFRIP